MVPFLIAAGASQHPRGRFLAALAIGRAVRYTILGLLGFVYGRWIITEMCEHFYVVIGGGVMVLISATVAFIGLRHESAFAR